MPAKSKPAPAATRGGHKAAKWTGKIIKLTKRGCGPARVALYQAAPCAVINDKSLRRASIPPSKHAANTTRW
ncbi:MAG: hypothetical protein LBC18_06405 [Opitutaceae bacterium]|nr:hypothetical protein [Opitutaceae bacterium]